MNDQPPNKANSLDPGNLTLSKFEAFINALGAQADADQPKVKLTYHKYGTRLDQPQHTYVHIPYVDFAAEFNTDALTKAAQTLGALMSDKPTLSPHIAHSARVMMTAALIQAKPELAMYITAINDDAREVAYIEDMRRVYGDQMVDAALDDARTSYRTFYHSLQLRIMADRLNNDFAHIRDAFTQLGKALGETLARGFADVQIDHPKNREERRSAKYGTRRKKEGDQQWARRNNPKRRR